MRVGMGYDVHKLVENRDLIGGFRLYVNDKVYDKSVLGALDRMRRTLLRR